MPGQYYDLMVPSQSYRVSHKKCNRVAHKLPLFDMEMSLIVNMEKRDFQMYCCVIITFRLHMSHMSLYTAIKCTALCVHVSEHTC